MKIGIHHVSTRPRDCEVDLVSPDSVGKGGETEAKNPPGQI